MLFLLSCLVNMTKEFQYAQVNFNCQADMPLCDHSSKVLLQLVERKRPAHLIFFFCTPKVSWLKNRFPFFPYKFVFLICLKHHSYNTYYTRDQISRKITRIKSSELQDKAKVESYKLYLVTKKMFDREGEGNKD